MIDIKKHWCGCKTERINGIVYFRKMCKRHKNNGKHIWIALQHKDTTSINFANSNNSPDIKPSNSVTKAKIQKPTPDNGTKLGSTTFVQEASP